jgi:hypothetical protein
MMRRTIVAAALAAITGLTLATSVAHAGGGMGAGAGVSTCRLIASGAANQPQSIAMVDPFTNTNDLPNISGDVVKINAAVLVCDLAATGVTVSGPQTGSPIIETVANSITCYSVSGANSAKFNATIQDPFTEVVSTSPQQVVLGAIQFVCVPSVTQ